MIETMNSADIAFPNLGIYLENVPKNFSVFGFSIAFYGLIIGIGVISGILMAAHEAKRTGQNPDDYWDFAIYAIIFSIIGARLYYVIFSWDHYKNNLLEILNLRKGGLAIYGAVIAAFIYCKSKKLPILQIFDLCSPGLFIGQIIGRWGNFVNAEVYGKATTLPWGMTINGEGPVHPLFLYESLWNLLGLIVLLLFRKHKKTDGQIFFFYCLWYASGRLLLEGMRQSQFILYVIPNILGISQLVAFCVIIISAVSLIILQKRK